MRQAAIIGTGTVGTALATAFEHNGIPTVLFDKLADHPWGAVLQTAVCFVCVDTPAQADGRLDMQNVSDVLHRLAFDAYAGLVVIRSTMAVGATAELASLPLRIVYSPEFLRNRSALEWSLEPDRLVFAGQTDDCYAAAEWFSWCAAPIIQCSYLEAEIGKLAHNARIAVMVSFTNEVEAMCADQGITAAQVMRIVSTDRRLATNDHLRPGEGAYGGKCVPKDTNELLAATGSDAVIAAARRFRDSIVPQEVVQ